MAERSFLAGDFLVGFSDRGVSSFQLIAQREKLHCFTVAEKRAGSYSGTYSTFGLNGMGHFSGVIDVRPLVSSSESTSES